METVINEGRGSVSLLQRALGIGYGRAARLIDFMAEDGIVGPYAGSQAREVVMSMIEWEQLKHGDEDSETATVDEPLSQLAAATSRPKKAKKLLAIPPPRHDKITDERLDDETLAGDAANDDVESPEELDYDREEDEDDEYVDDDEVDVEDDEYDDEEVAEDAEDDDEVEAEDDDEEADEDDEEAEDELEDSEDDEEEYEYVYEDAEGDEEAEDELEDAEDDEEEYEYVYEDAEDDEGDEGDEGDEEAEDELEDAEDDEEEYEYVYEDDEKDTPETRYEESA